MVKLTTKLERDWNGKLLIYNPGDVLKGTVQLSLNVAKKYTGLYVIIYGSANSQWIRRNKCTCKNTGHDKFEIQAKKFRVSDPYGKTLFYADRDLVEIAADKLRIEGDGGLIFENSIQTPVVKAEPGQDLKLESPTRGLEMQASQKIFIQSHAGSIEASSLNDIKLRARNIRFEAENIILPSMKTTQPPNYHDKSKPDYSADHKVYQVCVCESGRLFLAPSHSKCASDDANICR